jgi:hypothetical protein
MHNGVDGIAF